jgi:probable HAF family extracellular repeat protein
VGWKRLIDLGTLGGDNGEADWLNDAGEVVGIAQYTASCPNTNGLGGAHGFLWRKGVMTDLGTTDGIGNSEAVFINSKTQIVGYSFPCDLSLVEAFLWENGSTVNLNTLISFHSVFHLDLPAFINDRGEIGVFGSLANGDSHALLLIPCDENHPDVEGCDYSLVDVPDALVQTSAPIRNTFGRTSPQLHNRRMSAYHLPGTAIGPIN